MLPINTKRHRDTASPVYSSALSLPYSPLSPNRQTFYSSFLFLTQGFIFPSSLKKRKEKEIPPFIFFIPFFLISLYSITDFLHNLALQSPLQLSPVIKLSEQLYWQNHIPAWQTWAGGPEVWSRNWLCRLMERAGFRWRDSIENRKTGEEGRKIVRWHFPVLSIPLSEAEECSLAALNPLWTERQGKCTNQTRAQCWAQQRHDPTTLIGNVCF